MDYRGEIDEKNGSSIHLTNIYHFMQLGKIPRSFWSGIIYLSLLYIVIKRANNRNLLLYKIVYVSSIIFLYTPLFFSFKTYEYTKDALLQLDPQLSDYHVSFPEDHASKCSNATLQQIWNEMDVFIIGHVSGWIFKSFLFRNYVILWTTSIMWEFTEMCFAHILPNFVECWWDSILLDIIICNGLGIWMGMRMCRAAGLQKAGQFFSRDNHQEIVHLSKNESLNYIFMKNGNPQDIFMKNGGLRDDFIKNRSLEDVFMKNGSLQDVFIKNTSLEDIRMKNHFEEYNNTNRLEEYNDTNRAREYNNTNHSEEYNNTNSSEEYNNTNRSKEYNNNGFPESKGAPSRGNKYSNGFTISVKQVFMTVLLLLILAISELNTFFLKHVFEVPPSHPLVGSRFILIGVVMTPAIRKCFKKCLVTEVNASKNCSKEIGRENYIVRTRNIICGDIIQILECFMFSGIIISEVLLYVKHGHDLLENLNLFMVALWVLVQSAVLLLCVLGSVLYENVGRFDASCFKRRFINWISSLVSHLIFGKSISMFNAPWLFKEIDKKLK